MSTKPKDQLFIESMRAKLRLVAILSSAADSGLYPTTINTVHTLAYLCDALAPVWGLPILDARVLKRNRRPFFPRLQADLDGLVGAGVVSASDVSYSQEDEAWRLNASFSLRREFRDRIVAAAGEYSSFASDFDFVREVVFAASGLGSGGLERLGLLDAAYSDPFVDVGGMVEMGSWHDEKALNASARAALRIRSLVQDEVALSDAELIHLYVRHLYTRLLSA